MTHYRHDIRALIDGEQTEALTDGSVCQHVSVILTDQPPERPGRSRLAGARGDHVATHEARQLGFELLVRAEHAERIGQTP